jgi:hypothetical protein
MRFMILIKATKDSAAGVMPSERLLTEMGNFNEELVKAGVMLAGEGLHPTSKGARVRFTGNQRSVIDGPFAETKEQLLGFYVVDCSSLTEAIETAKDLARASSSAGAFEIRPLSVFRPGGNLT